LTAGVFRFVVTCTNYHGMHTGPLMDIPATRKAITSHGIDITWLANGKSVEHLGELDLLGLMQQLGVIPTPGQGGA
jgi:predicted ester cyclase